MERHKLSLTDYEKSRLGFKYDHITRCETYTFTAYKKNKIPILFGQIWITENNEVMTKVVDDRGICYPAYFNREYGYNEVVEIIDKNFERELKRMGAKPRGNDNSRKGLRELSLRNDRRNKPQVTNRKMRNV